MAEWLVEKGIGEERALLYSHGQVVAAKLRWPGGLEPGQIIEGKLVKKNAGRIRGLARFANGQQAHVDKLPRDAAEGAAMHFRVTRAAVKEKHRQKLAHVQPCGDAIHASVTLADTLLGAKVVRRFDAGDWEAVWDIANTGILPFPAGTLEIAPTSAMILIDVDGAVPARELALAAAGQIGRAINLLDLGGSIGVDFPTLATKDDRKAVNAALDSALAGIDHERTAMNGFGFVQIVMRSERASLPQLLQADAEGSAARLLLRQAERLDGPGNIAMAAHPAVIERLSDNWLAELARRCGTKVSITPDPGLAIAAGHAQLVSS